MANIRKRPLSFACLAVAAFLLFLVKIRPVPEEDYGAFEGKTLNVTGRVYAKETAIRQQGTVQILYLKLEKDFGPPGERVICYLDA